MRSRRVDRIQSPNLVQSLLLWCLFVACCTLSSGVKSSPVIAQAVEPSKFQAEQDYQTAKTMIESGSLLMAQSKLNQALKAYQTLNDQQGQYNCQVELARIDYQSGDYQQGQFKLRLAEQLINYGQGDGRAKTLQGLIEVELGDYRQALSDLTVGVHLLRVYGSRDRLGQQELNAGLIALGEVSWHQGLYQQGTQRVTQVLQATGSPELRRRALNILGSIQWEIGQYPEAKATFEQAAGVANTPGDTLGKAKTRENLGRVYQVLGDKKQALKEYQIALDELRSVGAWGRQVLVLNNLGLLAIDLGLNNRALKYLKSAEGNLSNSGGVGRVTTYLSLGYYYVQKQEYPLAIDYLERGLDWARSNGDRLGEAKTLGGLGEIQLQQQNYQQARDNLESSLAIFESLRPGLRDEQKISLAESQKYTYDLLQQAYIAQEQPAAALIVAERSRARAFVELLAQRTADNLESNLPLTTPSLQEIKAIAHNRQATLVSYSIISNQQGEESQLYIWVVNPQGDISFRRLDLGEIKQKFSTSVASVSSNSLHAAAGGLDLSNPRLQDYVVALRGDLRAQSTPMDERQKLGFPRDAYTMLIAPIKDLLPTDPQQLVVFIPHGALFLAPFPALQDNQGEFLIEQHTMQIAPAIQTLAMQPPISQETSQAISPGNGKSKTFSNPLIVGNPAPMPPSLSSLQGAEAEAKAIAKILGVTPIIGEAATEKTIIEQMPQAKLIHLATHGLFDEHQGLASSLAFSTKDNQDGFLTAAEILDLDLEADLVVLSACNTGRGKITGDGVVGLSRSFLLAGAQSTLVSLWDVSDLATSALMTDFYRQLQNNQTQPQALRQAMLDTMQTYPDPREWAAFILVGQ
jgi:CHAT domain-containing protein/tetratricopeptide (TPR) repeat protein